jgi:hypothetical protein
MGCNLFIKEEIAEQIETGTNNPSGCGMPWSRLA